MITESRKYCLIDDHYHRISFLGLIIVVLIVAPYPRWTTILRRNHYESVVEKGRPMEKHRALMVTGTHFWDTQSKNCLVPVRPFKILILNVFIWQQEHRLCHSRRRRQDQSYRWKVSNGKWTPTWTGQVWRNSPVWRRQQWSHPEWHIRTEGKLLSGGCTQVGLVRQAYQQLLVDDVVSRRMEEELQEV